MATSRIKELTYVKTFNNIECINEPIFTKPFVIYSNDAYQYDD